MLFDSSGLCWQWFECCHERASFRPMGQALSEHAHSGLPSCTDGHSQNGGVQRGTSRIAIECGKCVLVAPEWSLRCVSIHAAMRCMLQSSTVTLCQAMALLAKLVIRQMPARIMYINGFKGLRQFLDISVCPHSPSFLGPLRRCTAPTLVHAGHQRNVRIGCGLECAGEAG
jgi:hypothetical protein